MPFATLLETSDIPAHITATLWIRIAISRSLQVPIYILLAFVYTVLTQRFWKVRLKSAIKNKLIRVTAGTDRPTYNSNNSSVGTGFFVSHWQLLDTAWVLLFPAFSVGANLFFISLLDKYKADHVLNPLFQ